MTIINLRDFYYWYTQDEYMEVSDDVAEALRASVRYEAAYTERARYNKAYYSLDADDGIEYSACLHELTPDEVLELKERFCRLWNALNSLPEIQGRRVDACIILCKEKIIFYNLLAEKHYFRLNRAETPFANVVLTEGQKRKPSIIQEVAA